MAKRVSVLGLEGIPLMKAGDDLGESIVIAARNNKVEIEDGDIFVVAQKVVSKVEDRIVELKAVEPSEEAMRIAHVTGRDSRLVELVLQESKRLLKASQETIVVEDQRGIVNINAGIDKSNIEGTTCFAFLPVDPDESARHLRSRISQLTGKGVGVIISDTYSRAFRRGQVNFAIGLAGVQPFTDYRGESDLFGYIMKVKFSATVDEIAGAAELVMGQGKEAIPVAIVKGLNSVASGGAFSSKDLMIGENEDLFKSVR